MKNVTRSIKKTDKFKKFPAIVPSILISSSMSSYYDFQFFHGYLSTHKHTTNNGILSLIDTRVIAINKFFCHCILSSLSILKVFFLNTSIIINVLCTCLYIIATAAVMHYSLHCVTFYKYLLCLYY